MNRRTFLLSAGAFGVTSKNVYAGARAFASWPKEASAEEIGTRVTERYLATPMPVPLMYGGKLQIRDHIPYFEACLWYGALTFAQLTRSESLRARLITRFEPLFGAQANLIPTAYRGEFAFAAVPLELYMQTHESRYLTIGKQLAEEQWAPIRMELLLALKPDRRQIVEEALRDGRSWQTRALVDGDYWGDDAYLMIIPQIQAYRATGELFYIDRAARELSLYIEKLQQPNGLFHHGQKAPFFWGRGNGWVAAGITELLRSLPQNHASRPRLMTAYGQMMAGLLKYQAGSGLWRQLIDHPDFWPETSSTAMFTFALVTGVKRGWLSADTYAPAARKSWLALVKYINKEGDIAEVCEGTDKSTESDYYFNRKRNVGDPHGQAAVLWSAAALLM